MRKVTVLCLASDQQMALEHLQELGVLHLTPFAPPAGADLDSARQALGAARLALAALADVTPHPQSTSRAHVAHRQFTEETTALLKARQTLRDEQAALLSEKQRLEPFGTFDPDALRKLADHGIAIRLFIESEREPVHHPPASQRLELGASGRSRAVAIIGKAPLECTGNEVPLPERGLSAVATRLARVEKEIAQIDKRLGEYAAHQNLIATWINELENRIGLLEASAAMHTTANLAYLVGYCPAESVSIIQAAATQHGWGVLATVPAPEDDRVPTLVRYPRWVRPIQSVFGLIGIQPGYHEIDISAAFMVFFTLFFAMIIGDAGYGAIFLGATLLARRKFPKLPAYPFNLMLILSAATVAWGLLTGNVFAIPALPSLVRQLRVDWLLDEAHLIHFCFLIGAVHLTLAHAWNALRVINTPQAIAQVGWILITWAAYFMSMQMILGHPLPRAFTAMAIAGVVAIALFMTPLRRMKTEWHGHVMLPLDIIGSFVDLVSYLRLFAVGTASLAVEINFNEMAFANNMHGVLAGFVAALILVFGHLLNIVLGAMGVLVHGVRLNTLEFSRHIGMQWAGIRFAPYARRPMPPLKL